MSKKISLDSLVVQEVDSFDEDIFVLKESYIRITENEELEECERCYNIQDINKVLKLLKEKYNNVLEQIEPLQYQGKIGNRSYDIELFSNNPVTSNELLSTLSNIAHGYATSTLNRY